MVMSLRVIGQEKLLIAPFLAIIFVCSSPRDSTMSLVSARPFSGYFIVPCFVIRSKDLFILMGVLLMLAQQENS